MAARGLLGFFAALGLTLSCAQYGHVDFKTSCAPSIAKDFNTALSKLYSFEYGDARSDFNRLTSIDSSCCIAYFMAAASPTYRDQYIYAMACESREVLGMN